MTTVPHTYRVGPLGCDRVLGESLIGQSPPGPPSSISFGAVPKLDPIAIGAPSLMQQLQPGCDAPEGTLTHVFNWPMRATIQQLSDPDFTYGAHRLCEANGPVNSMKVTCNVAANAGLKGFDPKTCTYENEAGLRRTASVNIACA